MSEEKRDGYTDTYLALRRKENFSDYQEWPVDVWMIAIGPHMGKWTMYFGPLCLADITDAKEFLRNMQKDEYPDAVLEEYEINPKSKYHEQ